jgi:hypothetical protein
MNTHQPKDRSVAAYVRTDFVAAVVLTVLAPLVLLARAVRTRQGELIAALLSYWRASSLLMVAVYLLSGERRAGLVCGIVARLLIAYTVLRHAADHDRWYMRWRQLVSTYCVLGVLLNLPILRCLRSKHLSPLCQAYVASAQQFGDLIHPHVGRDTLARTGEWGLRAFVAGAVALQGRRLVK